MPNRLIALKYHDHDCLVHLFFNEEKMDVNLLDKEMVDDLHVNKFTVTRNGKLVVDESADIRVNAKALKEIYNQLLSQQGDNLQSMVA
jgi:hypothetical protein